MPGRWRESGPLVCYTNHMDVDQVDMDVLQTMPPLPISLEWHSNLS
jgi:hypothetical protein